MDSFYCPITFELMRDPVIDREGNSYEREAIEEWLRARGVSPITRNPLAVADLAPNRALRDAIADALRDGANLPTRGQIASISNITVSEAPLEIELDVNARFVEGNDGSSEYDEVYLHASIKVPDGTSRVPSDIVVVIDVSGSMSNLVTAKGAENSGLCILDIVKHAVKTIIQTLGDKDRLAIVKYSDDATVVQELICMSDHGKRQAEDRLMSLVPGGMTNLWDGLHTAMEVLKARSDISVGPTILKNAAIMLLTDGEPNIEPPRGHIPMLKRYAEGNGGKLPGIISTFGFGYNLDSPLLTQIANVAGGMYAFIPDSGMVGTAFVNSLGNILVTYATGGKLSFEPSRGCKYIADSNIDEQPSEQKICSWGLEVPTGSIQGGQSKDIIRRLRVPKGHEGAICSVTFACHQNGVNSTDPMLTVTKDCDFSAGGISAEASDDLDAQRFRNYLVVMIGEIMAMLQRGSNSNTILQVLRDRKEEIRTWASLHPASGPIHSASRRIADIFADIDGQVEESFSCPEYVNKWGKHYLPSLQSAHSLQQCHNFKDPGVQHYGGKQFESVRDHADDMFCKLPAPRQTQPSRAAPVSYSYNSGGGGNGMVMPQQAARAPPAAPITMAAFNNRDSGCFHGDCLVTLDNGKQKRVRDVRKGQVLFGGHTVVCVLKTVCDVDGGLNLVHLPGGLIITPYHPMKITCSATGVSKWIFPLNISPSKFTTCDAVYSFLIKANHFHNLGNQKLTPVAGNFAKELLINNTPCVALAHGIVGDAVASHDFFGTETVVKSMMRCQGWEEGLVSISQRLGCFKRDVASGRICDLVSDQQHGDSDIENFTVNTLSN